jgi:hypothetical protein
MLLISRDLEHLQVWPDDDFTEQVDVRRWTARRRVGL